jgi:hypothetical protein
MYSMLDYFPDVMSFPDLGYASGRLYKSKAKVPERNYELEALQMESLRQQIAQAKKGYHIPALPEVKPPPPVAPPPGARSADVIEAGRDARRQSMNRLNYATTIMAGNSSYYNPYRSNL